MRIANSSISNSETDERSSSVDFADLSSADQWKRVHVLHVGARFQGPLLTYEVFFVPILGKSIRDHLLAIQVSVNYLWDFIYGIRG